MHAIKIKNLNFGYQPDKPILKNVNLLIPYNKFICVLGHNGSGKSTLSKLLLGLNMPDSGSIHICDIKMTPSNLSNILKKLGLVFQNPDNQFIGLTPEEDIAFGLENRKVPTPIIKCIVKALAKFLKLESILTTNSSLLSGGQKQKVAIASVLASNPDIIIFDESTSMLDAENKHDIKQIMRDLVSKEGKTVISITHDMEELLVADEIIILKNGEVVKHAPSKEILQDIDLLRNCRLNTPFVVSLANKLSTHLSHDTVEDKTTYKNMSKTTDEEELLETISTLL